MKEGRTRLILPPEGGTGTLYIPANVVNDSLFPFQGNEKVLVRIRGRRLIVESEPRLSQEAQPGRTRNHTTSQKKAPSKKVLHEL